MCWQVIVGWDWAGISAIILWVLAALFYLLRKVVLNKRRLIKDLEKLMNGKTDLGDVEAVLDLILFVFECVTVLGGVTSVRGLLEEACENNS